MLTVRFCLSHFFILRCGINGTWMMWAKHTCVDDSASSANVQILNTELLTLTGKKTKRMQWRPNRATRKNVDLISFLLKKKNNSFFSKTFFWLKLSGSLSGFLQPAMLYWKIFTSKYKYAALPTHQNKNRLVCIHLPVTNAKVKSNSPWSDFFSIT